MDDGRCLHVVPKAVPWCPTTLVARSYLPLPHACAAISRGRVPQLTANGKYMVCAGRSNHVAILDTATLEA
jgi:hypothetical protein